MLIGWGVGVAVGVTVGVHVEVALGAGVGVREGRGVTVGCTGAGLAVSPTAWTGPGGAGRREQAAESSTENKKRSARGKCGEGNTKFMRTARGEGDFR